MMRRIALALALILASGDVIADGIVNPTTQFIGNMGEGISNSGTGGSGPVSCSNALDFTQACNSQYIGVL